MWEWMQQTIQLLVGTEVTALCQRMSKSFILGREILHLTLKCWIHMLDLGVK